MMSRSAGVIIFLLWLFMFCPCLPVNAASEDDTGFLPDTIESMGEDSDTQALSVVPSDTEQQIVDENSGQISTSSSSSSGAATISSSFKGVSNSTMSSRSGSSGGNKKWYGQTSSSGWYSQVRKEGGNKSGSSGNSLKDVSLSNSTSGNSTISYSSSDGSN